MAQRFATYDAFWLHYLREHSRPRTRALHYAGTGLAIGFLAAALIGYPWAWVIVPVAGYGIAWAAHFRVEKNRPATFTHPVWSLVSDFKMLALAATGGLKAELARAGIA